MSLPERELYRELYDSFQVPITDIDCGNKCAPYNENFVPFCCDINHAVPSAYLDEWSYLDLNTDLWIEWAGEKSVDEPNLINDIPDGQILVACKGHLLCQRPFRTITCRSFPFFPYIDREMNFIGITYYWEYTDRCWVISNLHRVDMEFRTSFFNTYDQIFTQKPNELENFHYHSTMMRRIFGRKKINIPLLHRDGCAYHVFPKTGNLIVTDPLDYPKYEPYLTVQELPFPGEVE